MCSSLIIHHPIYEAGRFLADEGRSECQACVAGLRQYSTAFPQFWDCADEIEQRYAVKIAQTTSSERTPISVSQFPNDTADWAAAMRSSDLSSKAVENRSAILVRLVVPDPHQS